MKLELLCHKTRLKNAQVVKSQKWVAKRSKNHEITKNFTIYDLKMTKLRLGRLFFRKVLY